MSGTTAFSRVLSLRDRKKSTNKGRLDINNLFSIDEKQKRLSREEERKVQDIGQRLVSLGITDVPQQRIEVRAGTGIEKASANMDFSMRSARGPPKVISKKRFDYSCYTRTR